MLDRSRPFAAIPDRFPLRKECAYSSSRSGDGASNGSNSTARARSQVQREKLLAQP